MAATKVVMAVTMDTTEVDLVVTAETEVVAMEEEVNPLVATSKDHKEVAVELRLKIALCSLATWASI